MTHGIGGVRMVVIEDSHTSGKGLAFKNDDGTPTGIRVPHGTQVIAFPKGKKIFQLGGRHKVEYTLVSEEI